MNFPANNTQRKFTMMFLLLGTYKLIDKAIRKKTTRVVHGLKKLVLTHHLITNSLRVYFIITNSNYS